MLPALFFVQEESASLIRVAQFKASVWAMITDTEAEAEAEAEEERRRLNEL